MLDELNEDSEPFDEYLELTQPSGGVFFEVFTWNFGFSKNWFIALFCDLARDALCFL